MSAALPADINSDKPLRLDIAAKIAFPDGTMGAAGLRKERDKGRLITEMIAGKEYVTLAEIDRMREKCRVQPKVPVSFGGRKAERLTDQSAARQDGTSRTSGSDTALDLAEMTAMRLKNSFRPISPKNTRRQDSATVTPIK